jgi:hypothetical protein
MSENAIFITWGPGRYSDNISDKRSGCLGLCAERFRFGFVADALSGLVVAASRLKGLETAIRNGPYGNWRNSN